MSTSSSLVAHRSSLFFFKDPVHTKDDVTKFVRPRSRTRTRSRSGSRSGSCSRIRSRSRAGSRSRSRSRVLVVVLVFVLVLVLVVILVIVVVAVVVVVALCRTSLDMFSLDLPVLHKPSKTTKKTTIWRPGFGGQKCTTSL